MKLELFSSLVEGLYDAALNPMDWPRAAQMFARAFDTESCAIFQLNLAQGSYFGRRTPEDGRIDWRQGARQVHDLVRAVAPPFPGAFTEANGCRLEILETRLDDGPLKYAAQAPCLYTEKGEWYADCIDGKRLKILQLAVNGAPVAHNTVPPALARQPLTLSSGRF